MTQKMIASSASLTSHKEKTLYDYLIWLLTFEIFRNPSPRVSVLRLSGPIGRTGGMRGNGLSLEDLNARIEQAFGYTKLAAVCLVINSPGGSPVQSELIASRIINLSKEKKVPVYTFVEDVAASGGYWLACSGDKIYASKSSIIGSIGVISSGFGFKDAIEKLGIERRVYTAGKNKSVLDPFSPAKKEDIELIKKLQTEIHANFKNYIKTRRTGRITQDDDIIFNGEFWSGEMALDYGLIDGIDDLYSFIKREFGKKVKIEYVTAKESWVKRRFGISSKQIAADFAAEIKSSVREISTGSKFDFE